MSTEENNFGIGEQIFQFEKHVLMPHSPYNYIVCVIQQKKFKQARWTVIEKRLNQLKENILLAEGDSEKVFTEIKNCIQTYNPNMHCNFNILADLCDPMLSSHLWRIDHVVCSIVDAALKISNLFPEPLILLRMSQNAELEITPEKVHCLLANAFLCTFPKRNGHEQYKNYPRINFNELFDDSSNLGTNSWQASARNAKIAKLKCFMNYFSRIKLLGTSGVIPQTIIYERRSLLSAELFNPNNLMQNFSTLHALPFQKPRQASGCLQVDFANKYVGGGTLGNGSVMEEIKFVTCPALVVSQLFVECLGVRDVLLVHRFEQFSSYTGYGATFEFQGNFVDENISDNHIVAMDANRFQRFETWKQFEKMNIEREINKCICAFKVPRDPKLPSRKFIVSGKWGCGVFNGHPQLKCLIQWIAASICEVPLELNTFGDTQLANEMNQLADALQTRKLGEIYPLILEYGRSIRYSRNNPDNLSLIEFILQNVSSRLENETGVLQPSEIESKMEVQITSPISEPQLETVQKIAIAMELKESEMTPAIYTQPNTIVKGATENEKTANISKNGMGTMGESLKNSKTFNATFFENNSALSRREKNILETSGPTGLESTKEDILENKEQTTIDVSIVDTKKTEATYLQNVVGMYLARIFWSFGNQLHRMYLWLQSIPIPTKNEPIQNGDNTNSQRHISTCSFTTSKSVAKKSSPLITFVRKWRNAFWSYITSKKGTIKRPSTSSESDYSDKD